MTLMLFGLLLLIVKKRHLIVILGDLEIVGGDLVVGDAKYLHVLILALGLVVVLEPLGLLDLLLVDLKRVDDLFVILEGQLYQLHGGGLELQNGYELHALLPGNLQNRREVLVQVPHVHVHTRKRTLDLLLRVFVEPHIVTDVQLSHLTREVNEQLYLIVLLVEIVNLVALLLDLPVNRVVFELLQVRLQRLIVVFVLGFLQQLLKIYLILR